MLTLAITSDTMPLSQVEDLVDTRLAPRISQLSGVGLVSISGGQKPAVRIQVNPTKLSSYGLNMEDVRTALTQASVNAAKGNFDGPRQDYQIDANDQITDAEGYKDVVIAYQNGAPVFVKDVANVVNGVENTRQAAWMNHDAGGDPEHPAAAGRKHHHRGQADPAILPQLEANLPAVDPRHDHDRHDHQHPGVGERRRVRADADHRAGGDGDLPLPAQPVAPPSFPAWRCRSRWSARSR